MTNNADKNQVAPISDVPILIADQYELQQLISETSLAKFFHARDLMSVETTSKETSLILAAVEPLLTTHPDFEQTLPRVLAEFTRPEAPVHIIDACQSSGVYWIVFQQSAGKMLNQYIQQHASKPLLPTETQPILVSILRAAKQISPHGGFGFLEPGAILYDGSHCQLLNAPLVILLHLLTSKTEAEQPSLTLQSPYISPEVAQGIPPTPQDDAFSIACIAYQLLQGSHPFSTLSSLAALAKNIQPAPLLHLKSESRTSLQRALALQRLFRIKSPYELVHALTEIPHQKNNVEAKTTLGVHKVAMSAIFGLALVISGHYFYVHQADTIQVAQTEVVVVPAPQENTPVAIATMPTAEQAPQPLTKTKPKVEPIKNKNPVISTVALIPKPVKIQTFIKEKEITPVIKLTQRTAPIFDHQGAMLATKASQQVIPPTTPSPRYDNTVQIPFPPAHVSQPSVQVKALQTNTFVVTAQPASKVTLPLPSRTTHNAPITVIQQNTNTFVVAAE